ncbi:hypothetical protein GCM10027429_03870 [Marivirga atlantica]
MASSLSSAKKWLAMLFSLFKINIQCGGSRKVEFTKPKDKFIFYEIN